MRSYSDAETGALLLCAMPAAGKQFSTSAYRRLQKNLNAYGYSTVSDAAGIPAADLLRLTGNEQLAVSLSERLSNRALLNEWLSSLENDGIYVLTIYSPAYPQRILNALGPKAPIVLFCAGEQSLLNSRCISLIGSRDLRPEGIAFAREAGRQIAAHGFVYCSGGARGADTFGFQAAIPDGRAVLFLPGNLREERKSEKYAAALQSGRLLLVSEHGCDLSFSAARALSRNRLIHSLSDIVLIAESRAGKGGTWNGTLDNLKNHWSCPYICSEEPANPGTKALIELGCTPVSRKDLCHLETFSASQISIF